MYQSTKHSLSFRRETFMVTIHKGGSILMKQMWQVRRGTVPLLQCDAHKSPDAELVWVSDVAMCWWCVNA
jgi:hypothetical protein